MKELIQTYFSELSDPRAVSCCSHLLSDILMIGWRTYISGGTDYQDICLFAKNRPSNLSDILALPNSIPPVYTFERVFSHIQSEEPEHCLLKYGSSLLPCLSEKQIVNFFYS